MQRLLFKSFGTSAFTTPATRRRIWGEVGTSLFRSFDAFVFFTVTRSSFSATLRLRKKYGRHRFESVVCQSDWKTRCVAPSCAFGAQTPTGVCATPSIKQPSSIFVRVRLATARRFQTAETVGTRKGPRRERHVAFLSIRRFCFHCCHPPFRALKVNFFPRLETCNKSAAAKVRRRGVRRKLYHLQNPRQTAVRTSLRQRIFSKAWAAYGRCPWHPAPK
jgi:hypothetical protein